MSSSNAKCRKPGELESAMAKYMADRKPDNLHNLVEAGKNLVCRFAGLYSPGRKNEDLLQAGYEGLLKAAARFDPERGTAFSTYAGHCIMGEMRHYIRKEASYCRSARIAELQQKINRVIEQYIKETGGVPSVGQIAERVNVKEEGVAEAMRAGWVPLDEVDVAKIQNIRHENFRLPIEDRIVLEQALNKLSELQRKVISLLFYRDLTQEETAARLGISQRKVSRILHKSLNKLARSIF